MGSPSRLTIFLDAAWHRAAAFFRRSPLLAYPATGVAALVVCGLLVWLIAFRGGSPDAAHVAAATPSPTHRPTVTAAPTATPTPTPAPEMAAAAVTPDSSSTSGSPSSNQGPAAESGMRFRIPSIGVDAPVTVRAIGSDGQMGAPNGRFDVVWYDFSTYPGMGGYPGEGGNAVFSGHVDYHPHYEAVFWDLHLVAPGDIIEVGLPDGTAVRYSVQWSQTISPEADFSSYVTRTGEDIITIVTCQGTFNSATHNYDHRLVVRGIRVP
jgi:LPXTG-site transpeptidase (sortase) family protein